MKNGMTVSYVTMLTSSVLGLESVVGQNLARTWQILFGEDMTNFLSVSVPILAHSCFKNLLSSPSLFRYRFITFTERIAHWFSMGLRSGDLAGHSSFFQKFNLQSFSMNSWVAFAVWQVAPSCMKMWCFVGKSFLSWGINFLIMAQYFSPLMVPL